MDITEIKNKIDYTNFITNCSDAVLSIFANDVKCCLTTGYFPENSVCLQIIDNCSDILTLDICIPVAFEFLRRSSLPF